MVSCFVYCKESPIYWENKYLLWYFIAGNCCWILFVVYKQNCSVGLSMLDEIIWQYLDWKFTCESIASWNNFGSYLPSTQHGRRSQVDRGDMSPSLFEVMMHSVQFYEVKVCMYLNTDWPRYLLDGGFCNYSTNSPNWHSIYILSTVPHFFLQVDAHGMQCLLFGFWRHVHRYCQYQLTAVQFKSLST